ncbi:acyl-CoA dehydrogenase family protein [Haloechinothrix sp. YIM 98757]|uniref:Acyl-CoA dehydrogenase family protein n=1 Tax=Haloechinothrix aidingensis TaxID=2752311 RepID=A0A838A619_9PSEU|nr:acyl-CoA dehydrogenase family protein [Haloechinothrix aidingensis]MBA0124225.1 acyl-CoA dehydrogenase family protein [Haloechinothrix aidingensis]
MTAARDTATQPSSFAKSLFAGALPDDMVFPYPRLEKEESRTVQRLISSAHDFLDDNYDSDTVEEQRWVGDEIIRGLGERGLLGLYVAPEYGGQGLSQTGYCRVMEEFGGYDASLSVVMGVHQSIGMKPIHMFGTEDQKARFLPDLASGRKLAGFGLTEPSAGSDAYNVASYAEQQADGSFVLNGEKRWIGNGAKDVVVVFARCESGHVALIVERGMDGFEAPHRFDTLGLLGNDLRKLTFNDVRVPKENVLGEPGDGFRIAMSTLNNGRMSLGTGVVGATKKLIEQAIEYTTHREQFGMSLSEFELVQDKVGWMVSYLYGLESMAYLTTGLVDSGVDDYSIESAMSKVSSTEFIWYAVNRVFQLMGGTAYMADSPIARTLRDTRIFPIFEGANDVLRAFIALSGMKVIADEFEDLRKVELSDPIRTMGTIADFVRGRVSRTLNPAQLETAHPALDKHADAVADQTKRLRGSVEKLLRAHGKDVKFRQRHQKRLADASTDIFAQVATISRTTALFADQGVEASGQEHYIADSFCNRAAARVRSQLNLVEDNDDQQIHSIARAAYNHGGYGPKLH